MVGKPGAAALRRRSPSEKEMATRIGAARLRNATVGGNTAAVAAAIVGLMTYRTEKDAT